MGAKILGQSAPSATTETTLYTVPASKVTVVSTVVICNRGSSSATVRLYVAEDGAATANKQYLMYDYPIGANDSRFLTIGMTLDAADEVQIYASTADTSWNLFGTEDDA